MPEIGLKMIEFLVVKMLVQYMLTHLAELQNVLLQITCNGAIEVGIGDIFQNGFAHFHKAGNPGHAFGNHGVIHIILNGMLDQLGNHG
ncbi:MAG: hypothetical protein ACD_6C00193G0001 [uncultured bacterium]|nr:MAG: hypothetical protein ACD_6C00193G0001 [uncultured bacterium]